MHDTQTQIDRLIELAIVQRTELKQLVEQLPELREHLNAEIEKVFDEVEPQLRVELEDWTAKQTADQTAKLGATLEAKITELAKALEVSTQARYSAILAEREKNFALAAEARAKIAEHAASLPETVKGIVDAELARFPRAGEIDQLRKEFAEPRGLNPRGKWTPDQTYNRLDLVAYNGDSYVSNRDGNTEKPSRTSANWTLSAARGAGGGGGGITSLNDILNAPTSGQIIGSEGSQFVPKTLTAGTGISITDAPGSITIDATGAQETLTATVKNAESVAITKGQVVYLFSATGGFPSVKLAYNTSDATSAKTFGVVSDTSIAPNGTGTVTCVGVVSNLNLGTYSDGDTVYLGATPGSFTATKPYAPNHLVYVGIIERANAGNGELYVRIQNGYELDEIHDVQINAPKLAGQTLIYDQTNDLWKNARLTAGVGVSISNADSAITISADGGVNYQGTWNASTNTPTLTSSVGTKGFYYVVSVAGSTNLDGITDWQAGDWAVFNGTAWEKVDTTDQVSSVFGRTGAVVGVSTDYSAVGITNTAVGATNPSTGAFTTLNSSSTTQLNGTTIPASKTLVVTTDKISALAATSSSELAGVITDETGSGALVFANSPTLVTPSLGTPSVLVGTNITGTAAGLTAGNVTTNANLTGAVTSVGNATSLGSFSSANLAAALTDETGSGANVFANTPTLITPNIGAATGTSVNLSGAGTFGGNLTVNGGGVASGSGVNLTAAAGSSGASLILEEGTGSNSSATISTKGTGSLAINNTSSNPNLFFYVNGALKTQINYVNSTSRFVIDHADSSAVQINSFGGGNVLIGTSTDSGNGKLQLATHTTSAGGIGFGTDTSLYRTGANRLSIGGIAGLGSGIAGWAEFSYSTYFDTTGFAFAQSSAGATKINAASGQSVVIATNANNTALTLDSSQNATFAGNTAAFGASGTGGANSQIVLKGGSAANGGGAIVYQKNGTTKAWAGLESSILGGGSTSDNYIIYTASGLAVTVAGQNTTLAGNLTVSGTGSSSFSGVTSASGGSINITSSDPAVRLKASGTVVADGNTFEVRNVGVSGTNFLQFRTVNDANSVFTTRMALWNSGGLYLGTDPVGAGNPGAGNMRLSGNLTVSGEIIKGNTSGYLLYAIGSGGNTGFYYPTADGGIIDWYSNNTRQARLNSTGNLLLGTTTDGGQKLQVAGTASISGNTTLTATTASTSTSTGALVVSGGVGVAKGLYVGEEITAANGTSTAPSIRFSSATTSGFSRVNTNSIGIVNNGIASGYLDGITGSGGLYIAASGTNQGITLAANGTGTVVISGAFQVGNAYVAGAPTATGYIVIKDSTGTSYKIPAVAL